MVKIALLEPPTISKQKPLSYVWDSDCKRLKKRTKRVLLSTTSE